MYCTLGNGPPVGSRPCALGTIPYERRIRGPFDPKARSCATVFKAVWIIGIHMVCESQYIKGGPGILSLVVAKATYSRASLSLAWGPWKREPYRRLGR